MRVKDDFRVLRDLIKYWTIAAVARVLTLRAFSLLLPPNWASKSSWLILAAAVYRGLGATPLRLPPHPTDHFGDMPFFGTLLSAAKHRHTAHNYLFDGIRAAGFKTTELRVPGGVHIFFLMDPLDREYVLKTNWKNYLKNRDNDVASIDMTLGEVLGRGIFATDLSEWQDQRKIASHMFSGNGLKFQMESVFNAHAAHTLEAFEKLAAQGRVFDIQDVFQSVVFDAFCEIAFGLYPDATKSALEGVKPAFLVSFDFCQLFSAQRVVQSPLQWRLSKLLAKAANVGPDAEFQRHLAVVDDYVYDVVRRRKQEQTADKQDLLSLYINHARETGQAHMLEDVYLRDTIVNFMIAGRDTTSCTLTNMCRYLSEHPDIVARLRADDFSKIGSDGRISWETANQLHLVHAVFNESIRLAPPVGDDFKIAVGSDVLPSGVVINEGDRVFTPNVAIGRDPMLWHDPGAFKPDRWLNVDDNGQVRVRRPDEYVFPVFWAGQRLCLGKDMSRFEATVFCAKLFAKLDFVSEPAQENKTFVMGPVIFYNDGWRMRVRAANPR